MWGYVASELYLLVFYIQLGSLLCRTMKVTSNYTYLDEFISFKEYRELMQMRVDGNLFAGIVALLAPPTLSG